MSETNKIIIIIKFKLQYRANTLAVRLLLKRRSDEESTSSHGRAFQILPTLWLK